MTFRGAFERDLKDFAADESGLAGGRRDRRRRHYRHHSQRALLPSGRKCSTHLTNSSPLTAYRHRHQPLFTTLSASVRSRAKTMLSRTPSIRSLRASIFGMATTSGSRQRFGFWPRTRRRSQDFLAGRYQKVFERSQFGTLGGLAALARFQDRDAVFEALAQSILIANVASTCRDGGQPA